MDAFSFSGKMLPASPWWQGLQYIFGAWMVYFAAMTFFNPHCVARRGLRWLTMSEPTPPSLIDEDAATSVALIARPAQLDR